MTRIEMLKMRLKTYPGAGEKEVWKNDRDLTHCTDREKAELKKYGLTIEGMMAEGFTRGEVHHMIFGYRHAKEAAS